MTSRDVLETGAGGHDQLGTVIRWALCEDAVDATPPTGVWEQIRERLEHEPGRASAQWRLALRAACRSAALWLLDAAVEPPIGYAYWGHCSMRCRQDEAYLSLLMCPHDLSMRLGQLV